MGKQYTQGFEIAEFAADFEEAFSNESRTNMGEKDYYAVKYGKESGNFYQIVADNWTAASEKDKTVYASGTLTRKYKKKSIEENIHALEAENKLLRELLDDKSSGVGLMRISLVCSIMFFLFYLMGVYTPLILVHPVISLMGLIGSLGFFCMGWINSKP